jgi:DNA-binding beta-propeller fold protein YncE
MANFSKILSLTATVAVLVLTTLKAEAAVLVSSPETNSIKTYDEKGNFIRDFVPPGSGGLQLPNGLAIGPDGNLYVSDTASGNVLRYNGKTGDFIDVFVPRGTGDQGTPGLQVPTGIGFGLDGDLYVSNYPSVPMLP